LNEGAHDHHERAEGKIAAEVSRGRDYDRRDQREPAVTCRDPGEPRGCAYDPPHDAENVLQLSSEALLLILFAAVERDNLPAKGKASARNLLPASGVAGASSALA